jgi:soluble lytic murein transglycosylase-like protein
MNLHRRKFLRQAMLGGGPGFVVSNVLAPVLLLTQLYYQQAWAGNQAEEALSDSVRTALSQAVSQSEPPVPVLNSELEKKQFNEWMSKASQRLSQWTKHPDDRSELLHTVWYEARRAGLSLSLVLAVIEVESAFRKYAISSAGARGLMQVMPFWTRSIGDGNESALFHTQTQLRFGCVILRYMMEREGGDLFYALGRYNGSRGLAAYPTAVLAAQKKWLQSVD